MEKKKTIKTTRSGEKKPAGKRDEILELCYQRLHELIPACANEVTLLKCIEILEKQHAGNPESDDLQALTDTLERLSELGR